MKLLFASIFTAAYIWFSVLNVSAQNCGDALSKARTEYEKGRFQEAINEVKPCVANSLDKTEQWQAYKLMALSYLYLNDESLARDAAIKMLELYPTYKANRLKEPKEFIKLVESVNVIPKFSLGVSVAGGINRTKPVAIASYNVSSFNKTYTSGNGYQFGIFTDYHFNKNIAVESGVFWSAKKYGFNYETSGFTISGSEKLTYLEIPLCAKIMYGNKRIVPYINAGGFVGFLMNATNDITRNYTSTGESYEAINLPSQERRNNNNYGWLAGGGIMTKLGAGSLIIDYRYLSGIPNISKTEGRYSNQELMYSYYYLDDDIVLRNSVLSISYAYYLSYKVLKNRK